MLELDHIEGWVLKNDAFELWCWRKFLRDSWIARISSKSIVKETDLEYWKNWCWSWSSNTSALWCEELTYLKRPWCRERLKAGGEADDREWDGRMASLTQWTWVWVNSRSWWWTGGPGVLQSMGSQRVGCNWVEQQLPHLCLSCHPDSKKVEWARAEGQGCSW